MCLKYEYIRARIVSGQLLLSYKVPGLAPGRMAGDEDVADWTDDDIRMLAGDLLGVDDDARPGIEVIWD